MKKILIVTQKVNMKDPILGFFHRWIIEFAKHYSQVTVICLEQGRHDLPDNVKVLSLHKELGVSKLKYVWNFYKYIWQERKNYDLVFVHMNQEYILLGCIFWMIIGKKILLWRNHPMGSYLTKLAVLWSDQVFCTSKQSFTARYSKTQIMPVGIDTDFFTKQVMDQKPNSIVVVSRISPIKNIHLIIEALKILAVDGVKFTADFYGDCLPKDKEYCSQILNRVSEAGMTDFVRFNAAIPNHKTPEIYSSHEVFINATPSGSLDKTIFEAGACETFVITSNQSLSDVLPKESVFMENDPENLAQNIKNYFSLSSDHKSILVKQIHDFVLEKHSLKKLVKMIS